MNTGILEIICGPMFSGKTSELIRKIKLAKIAKYNILVFKPNIDSRYIKEKVCTNDDISIESIPITTAKEILKEINEKQIDKIYIDEVQFFTDEIVDVVEKLTKEIGIDVTVAGLINDFKGEPFGSMGELLARAQKIVGLKAICTHEKSDGSICGNSAYFTQRFIKNKPASYDSPIILVGGLDHYAARCKRHWKVPNRPKKLI